MPVDRNVNFVNSYLATFMNLALNSLTKIVHEMSPILKNSVHEMSPFESVHEKSPILKNSVHEMSLSTKCLHPCWIRAKIEISSK